MSRAGARRFAVLLLALGVGAPTLAAAQQGPEPADNLRREILDSQRRLEEIRAERARLQEEMAGVRSRVQDVSGELENIERQISASRSAMAELEFQAGAMAEQVDLTTADLERTRSELASRQVNLARRIREIYKGGPLHTSRVLFGAQSFSDLLNRYHYLRLIASHDRALIESVRQLESELDSQNAELGESLRELERLRQAQLGEMAELQQVEDEHQRTLAQFRSREVEATTRLDVIAVDEQRLTSLMSTLDRQRIDEDRRRTLSGLPSPGGAELTGLDAGRLDWPVQGEVAYQFGLERRGAGAALRRNGLGISAPAGAPVTAVRPGTVAHAGPFEGYGPSVIVSHGGGYYTLYLYLEDVGAVQGRRVEAGQVVGTVGGRETPEGPHIEFQLRAPLDGGPPQAVDPLPWLSPEGSGG
jgi:septal ring factor EnvC (AmiA/AmiB activator)